MENINQSLLKIAPMLPPADNTSVMGSDMKSNYSQSKFLNDDAQSIRSMPMSVMTRKSNFTMLTH